MVATRQIDVALRPGKGLLVPTTSIMLIQFLFLLVHVVDDPKEPCFFTVELQADPILFFPATHDRVMDQIEAVSFQANPIDGVARQAVEILNREMSSSARAGTSRVQRGFNLIETEDTRFLTFIGVLRSWEFLKQMFSLG